MAPARNVINVLFALLIFAVMIVGWAPPGDWIYNASDFPHITPAAKLIASGHGADAYKINYMNEKVHHYYPNAAGREIFASEPPFFLACLAPLALFPPQTAKLIFDSILVTLSAIACVILANVLNWNNRKTLVLIALTTLSGPFLGISENI